MPVILPEGIRVPASGDSYDLTEDLRKMMESATTIVPVTSSNARAALVAALNAASRPIDPDHPVYVHREDAPRGQQLESTINGTDWVTHGAVAGGMNGLTFDANGNATLMHGLKFTPSAVLAMPVVASTYGTAITLMVRADGLPDATRVLLRARIPSGPFTGALPVMWIAVG